MKDELSKSLERLRREKWVCEIVGRRGIDGKTIGLFGFASIVAIKDDVTMLVSAVSDDYAAQVLAKILKNSSAKAWLSSPGRRIIIHAWTQVSPHKWQCVEHEVDFRKAKKS